MTPIPFAVVGSGWRAEYFLRVAKALPENFSLAGIVTGRPVDGRQTLADKWNTPVFSTVEELLNKTRPAFVVVSVRREDIFDRIAELVAAGMPILAETPPAADPEGLLKVNALVKSGARIEVAEQYFLHPILTAMRNAIAEGLIGSPTYAHVSIIQTYHGISLMRKFLGAGFENATVSANQFTLPVAKGPGRYEQPERYEVIGAEQMIGTFDFGDRIGIYDYAEAQHRSRIRQPRVTIRGERGEVTPQGIDYLLDEKTPVSVPFIRKDTGHFMNFEGYSHAGIMLGERWIYKNPFEGPALSDDEIAVASCLENMRAFVEQGLSSYSFAEAAQDCYLAEVMTKASSGKMSITTSSQSWHPAPLQA